LADEIYAALDGSVKEILAATGKSSVDAEVTLIYEVRLFRKKPTVAASMVTPEPKVLMRDRRS